MSSLLDSNPDAPELVVVDRGQLLSVFNSFVVLPLPPEAAVEKAAEIIAAVDSISDPIRKITQPGGIETTVGEAVPGEVSAAFPIPTADPPGPNLGMATTRELLNELAGRLGFEVAHGDHPEGTRMFLADDVVDLARMRDELPDRVLNYRSVDG